mgnify:CR=1 FL=1
MTISRTEFLGGDLSGRNKVIRPPWSLTEQLFTQTCNSCGDCINQCPTHILKPGRGQLPVIDFNQGECLFCGECAKVCQPGAIDRTFNQNAWSIVASLTDDSCIAHQNVECRACYDPCEPGAIKFIAKIGGPSRPSLDPASCTGCGACLAVCPVTAISMVHLTQELA